MEDDDVAPPLPHQLPVAAAQRLGASTSGPPPARTRAATRPLRRPPPPARPSPQRTRAGRGAFSARAHHSGIGVEHDPPLGHARVGSTQTARSAASRPGQRRAPARPPRAGARRGRRARASWSSSAPCSLAGGPEALDAQAQRRRPGPGARAGAPTAPARCARGPPAPGGRPPARASRRPASSCADSDDRAQRAPAPLGPRQQPSTSTPSTRPSATPLAGVAHLHRLLQALLRTRAGAAGCPRPQASPWASTPGRPEAVGQRRAPELARARPACARPGAPSGSTSTAVSSRKPSSSTGLAGQPAPGLARPPAPAAGASAPPARPPARRSASAPAPIRARAAERAAGGGDASPRACRGAPAARRASK